VRPGWTGCSSTTAAERSPPPSQPHNPLFLAWLTASAGSFTVPVWSAGSTKPWSIMSSTVAACRWSRYTAPVLIIARSRRRWRPSFPARDTGGSIRIPDLPGMGRSTAAGISCNDDVVTLLGDFIDHLGLGPVMLLGHSYGAYLARGVAARRPELVLGLALLCPVSERSTKVPAHRVVRQDTEAYDELEPQLRTHRPPLAATATTLRRVRRWWMRPRWGAFSPGGRSRSGRARSRRRP